MPDLGELALQLGPWGDILLLDSLGLWQPLAVELAVRCPRHLRQHHQIRRHHELRQRAPKITIESLCVQGSFAGDHVPYEPLVAPLAAHHHHRLTDAALREDLRLDLPSSIRLPRIFT